MNRMECPQCSTRFKHGADRMGKKIECPKCGRSIRLPATATLAQEVSRRKPAGSPSPRLYWLAAGLTLIFLTCGTAGYLLYQRMNSRVNSTNAKIITDRVFSKEGMTLMEAEKILGPGKNNGTGPGGQWFETIWGDMGGEHIRVRYGPGGRIFSVSENVKEFEMKSTPLIR